MKVTTTSPYPAALTRNVHVNGQTVARLDYSGPVGWSLYLYDEDDVTQECYETLDQTDYRTVPAAVAAVKKHYARA